MRLGEGATRLSASDKANHLGHQHLTELDLAAVLGRLTPPTWRELAVEFLQPRGFEHEGAYFDHLREIDLQVVDSAKADDGMAIDSTISVMQAGIGSWSYEVMDTKLTRETSAGSTS